MVCPSDRLKIEQSGSGGLHYIALFLHMILKRGMTLIAQGIG